MRLFHLLFPMASLVAALTSVAAASGPTFWTVATAADFLKGTSEGVYVSLSGTVTAGPQLTNRLTSTPAQIWSLAETPDGTIWAGTGADGRLVRLRPGQQEETVFDTPENNVFAVAISGSRVYAASSPDGKVYVIDGSAPARTFFDPSEKYIWSLAVDGAGRLWVGAGNPAVIYRVSPDGSNQVVYRPPAAHVVSLAADTNVRMLAGTEAPGRLYRIDQQDRPFVLLESGLAEMRAISVDANGTMFAAAIAKGEESSDGGETTSVAVTLAPPPTPTPGTGPSTTTTSSTSASAPARRSTIYRIDPSGTWEQMWATADLVYDLAAQGDGGVLVATGPEGRLYKVERGLDVLLLTGVDARQVTRFAARARGTGLSSFATANPGRVVSVGAGVQSPARYLSSVQDTKTVATWGLIRWESTGGVTLSTRTGNTDKPDDSWSEWSPAYTRREGEQVTSPPARFMQWRAVFAETAAAGGAPPGAGARTAAPAGPPSASSPERAQLMAVTLAYLPRNNRPSVSSLTVHPPGVVFQRPFVNDESAIAGLDEEAAEARRPPGDTARAAPAPGRRMYQKGLQTLSWRAEDSDGDRLEYSLQYRREGDTTWRTLRSGLSNEIFVWDTTTVGDGRYVVRVQASDKADNVGDRALTAERESDPVEVDNTPPMISTEPSSGTPARLVVRVTDTRSPIQKLEYSIGGGAWQTVYPADGLADSPNERFEITLPSGAEITQIVLRATDRLQNVISAPVSR